jgi:hypothetical protein
MAQDLVIWCGPVSPANLKTARLPAGARVVTINRGAGKDPKAPNSGSSNFELLASQVGGSLRTLLDGRGVDLDAFRSVTLAGFSAGWGLMEPILRGTDGARVDVLYAADAYYGRAVKPGYRAFLERAAGGRALAILTTSTIAGPTYPSATAGVEKLVDGLGLEPMTLAPALPRPVRALGKLGAVWCDYGLEPFKHVGHATKLAPLFFSHVVTPYLERRALPGAGGAGDGVAEALAALGLFWVLS